MCPSNKGNCRKGKKERLELDARDRITEEVDRNYIVRHAVGVSDHRSPKLGQEKLCVGVAVLTADLGGSRQTIVVVCSNDDRWQADIPIHGALQQWPASTLANAAFGADRT
jgi:predicted neutral ceramidase superfamily lipid hydrolase